MPEFEKVYYEFFLGVVPENELSDYDNAFFAEVQEKLDWTNDSPSAEEKKYGWMDHREYIEWVRKRLDEYLKNHL